MPSYSGSHGFSSAQHDPLDAVIKGKIRASDSHIIAFHRAKIKAKDASETRKPYCHYSLLMPSWCTGSTAIGWRIFESLACISDKFWQQCPVHFFVSAMFGDCIRQCRWLTFLPLMHPKCKIVECTIQNEKIDQKKRKESFRANTHVGISLKLLM